MCQLAAGFIAVDPHGGHKPRRSLFRLPRLTPQLHFPRFPDQQTQGNPHYRQERQARRYLTNRRNAQDTFFPNRFYLCVQSFHPE
jgi:hypothetical protein